MTRASQRQLSPQSSRLEAQKSPVSHNHIHPTGIAARAQAIMHDGDNSERPVREKLRNTSIAPTAQDPKSPLSPSSDITMASDDSAQISGVANTGRTNNNAQSEKSSLKKKRSFEDGEATDQPEKHVRKRSRSREPEKPEKAEDTDRIDTNTESETSSLKKRSFERVEATDQPEKHVRKRSRSREPEKSEKSEDTDLTDANIQSETSSLKKKRSFEDVEAAAEPEEPVRKRSKSRDPEELADAAVNHPKQAQTLDPTVSTEHATENGSEKANETYSEHPTTPPTKAAATTQDDKETVTSPKNKRSREEFLEDHVDEKAGSTIDSAKPDAASDTGVKETVERKDTPSEEPKSKRHRDSSSPQPEDAPEQDKSKTETGAIKVSFYYPSSTWSQILSFTGFRS